jgi:hypothetical protein
LTRLYGKALSPSIRFEGVHVGLNQAPIVVMIENYRSGLAWELFMSNADRPALDRIGFEPDLDEKVSANP